MKVVSKKIDVVVITDREGNMRPIRFRFKEEDESTCVVNVARIQAQKRIKDGSIEYMTYSALITANNIQQICELRYDFKTCIWYLWKL